MPNIKIYNKTREYDQDMPNRIPRAQTATRQHDMGPQGFGENGYIFLGSCGALVIILGDLWSKLIVLGI